MKIVAQNHISNSPLISLSLFLRLGIQLCFTASMPMLLFTTNQICYHECEAKMKRSQIGVRKRISELLCVKSTSFFFFSSIWYLISGQNPVYIPVWPVFKILNRYETPPFLYQCTKYTGQTGWYNTKSSSLSIMPQLREIFHRDCSILCPWKPRVTHIG